nr:MAG TPA: AAA domain protein [Caudoviricetes sp.]
MSYACLVLGESGTGKTCSLRNLDPKNTLLIQPVRKPLPFRSTGWKEIKQKGDGNNILVCSNPQAIINCMHASPFDVIVVDDWQYILASMYMAARNVKGFDKFTEIGGAGFDIAKAASELGENKRVYVLAHTTSDEFGNTRIKTLGKLLDDKIVVEGMFTTVLRTHVENGRYLFSTQNSGSDTVKSPMGMFSEQYIENDLAAIDRVICDYYGITNEKETEE